jgi:hypothetical protein
MEERGGKGRGREVRGGAREILFTYPVSRDIYGVCLKNQVYIKKLGAPTSC